MQEEHYGLTLLVPVPGAQHLYPCGNLATSAAPEGTFSGVMLHDVCIVYVCVHKTIMYAKDMYVCTIHVCIQDVCMYACMRTKPAIHDSKCVATPS